MNLSLNQVENTARKAVRGAGLPWCLAEDAGRAVRWLEMMGLPGTSWLLLVLASVGHRRTGELLLRQQSGPVWRAAGGTASPLVAGPSLVDAVHLHRDDGGFGLTLQGVVCPELCAGYLGVASLQTGAPLAMSWARGDMRILGDRVFVDDAQDVGATAETYDLAVRNGSRDPGRPGREFTGAAGSRRVDPRILDMLETLARRTYVESTEMSRLSGAGAGLSDTD
ncbi:MAG: DUF3726 domain-containing protein [Gammaproteobacteria bacterium]|nr:DUF3726 domain-containing protein [Gammaproteobacteria bacterium]MYG66233.1 DUF3726 domain-containing protein [Gammaproteobacteria bacterium]